jgi:hypothetical protein
MSLLLRVPWAVQPSGVARVHWGNSLTRGLQFLITPAGNLLAQGQPFTFIGSGRIEPGPAGLAVRSIYTGAGANEATIPVVANASGDRTLVTYAGNTGTIVNDFPTHRIADADSTDYLCFGSTTFHGLIDNNFAPAITIVQSNQPRIGAARRRSNQVSAWFDGVATTESITGTRAMTATSARIGRDGSANSFDSQTYWLAYWDRYLNDAELASLRVDPWQLFEPRRIIIPSAGAGGGTAAITSAAGAATTSTLAGSSVSAANFSAGAGVATASTLAGSSTAVAAFTAADGAATTSTLTGVAGSGSTITAAAGVATTSTLAASSIAVSAFTAATGAATASSMAGRSAAAAAFTAAAGVATASTMVSVTGSSAIDPASGMAVCSVLAGSSIAVGAFLPAAGVATCSTMADAGATIIPTMPPYITVWMWRRDA